MSTMNIEFDCGYFVQMTEVDTKKWESDSAWKRALLARIQEHANMVGENVEVYAQRWSYPGWVAAVIEPMPPLWLCVNDTDTDPLAIPYVDGDTEAHVCVLTGHDHARLVSESEALELAPHSPCFRACG